MVKTIDPKGLNDLIRSEKAYLIDVREPAEYAAEYIEGARFMPLQLFLAQVSQLRDFDKKIPVIYCKSGYRSGTACEALFRESGVECMNLEGGITAWKASGFKTLGPNV